MDVVVPLLVLVVAVLVIVAVAAGVLERRRRSRQLDGAAAARAGTWEVAVQSVRLAVPVRGEYTRVFVRQVTADGLEIPGQRITVADVPNGAEDWSELTARARAEADERARQLNDPA